jgi:hypothetical protein
VSDSAHFTHRRIGLQREQVRHRQRILERRIRALLTDAHLLKAERLPCGQHVVGRRELVLLIR